MAEATSARAALITELLSDVGRLHDEIKALPKEFSHSMRDSLQIVADAVEEAERTAKTLQQTTDDVMRATSAKACVEIGMELTSAISQSMEKVFEPALNRAAFKVEELEKRVAAISGQARDAHATRFNYFMLAGFVLSAAMMIGAMAWIAVKAQDVNETNKWFYDEYKAQNKVIDSLPAEIKQRFKR